MSKCKTCEHAKRTEPYYDVKCLKKQIYIYDANKKVWCDDYKEKKKDKKK